MQRKTDSVANAINDDGTAAGSYSRGAFIRSATGQIQTFSIVNQLKITPEAINKAGTVTGYCADSSLMTHGFVRRPDGTISTFDNPAWIQAAQHTEVLRHLERAVMRQHHAAAADPDARGCRGDWPRSAPPGWRTPKSGCRGARPPNTGDTLTHPPGEPIGGCCAVRRQP